MRKNKDVLKIILIALIAIFLMMGIVGILLVSHKKSAAREQRRKEALEALDSVPVATPTPAVTATPTPAPTATPTPTPVPTILPAFNPDDYWDSWYSTDGMASINIYNISLKSVSFYFSQSNKKGTVVCEADVTAEVAGNAARFSFHDSQGSRAKGNLIFDQGQLYVKIATKEQAEGVSVSPSVDCIMVRECPAVQWEQDPTSTPPTPTPQGQETTQSGDYFFPESNSRYLTDEEISVYSSSDLELAKNEIYARHGRRFITERIADYFNSKSWYQGVVDPESFDARQSSIFNEYEIANIAKIVQWEEEKRSAGQ